MRPEADLAIDDIIDSGATAERMKQEFGLKTLALVDKQDENLNEWVHFPWEEDDVKDIEWSLFEPWNTWDKTLGKVS